MSGTSPQTLACPHCPGQSSRQFSPHGLLVHIGRMHKDVPRVGVGSVSQPSVRNSRVAVSPPSARSPEVSNQSTQFEKIASLRSQVRILRHIPKGARSMAAGRLCELIALCIRNNSPEDWYALLSFAFSAFRVPASGSSSSLTTLVKNNIASCRPALCEDAGYSGSSPSIVKAIETKVQGGDLRGAARLLLSDDSFACASPCTLAILKSKHPAPSRPLSFPPAPCNGSGQALTVRAEEVAQALNSFFNSSAAGLDGIRPSHLKELTDGSGGDNGPRLLDHLTRLCNFLLSGQVNPVVCPYLYGATLCALEKKDGGVRPIAIGSVFRRLTAKLGCRAVRGEMAAYLGPHQLGFGTERGCEAAIHAVRAFVEDPDNVGCVILKFDIRNAFNSLERDVLLTEASDKIPSLYPFLYQLYHSPSNLFYNQDPILSQVGAQQGDPLGPLIFSLGIQTAIADLRSPLSVWYLDDGTIGGKPDVLQRDLRVLLPRLKELGLEVNTAKCEFFPCSPEASRAFPLFESLVPGLKELDSNSFSLLGSPIFPSSIPEAILARQKLLLNAQERLQNLSAHVALSLLRVCFAVPKLMYLLRTTPTWLYPANLSSFDGVLKQSVESILNVSLNDAQWDQASLPIRHGGLGVRRAGDVSLPAFLASVHGVASLVTTILPNGDRVNIPHASGALAAWSALNPGVSVPAGPHYQRSWDEVGSKTIAAQLLSRAVGSDLARLRAVSQSESGAWLHALPSPSLGTHLDNDSLRVAVALRLGCDVCEPHRCICGIMVEANGHHALSCCRCAGRFPRHHALNDIVRRALVSANVPCMLEPPGLSRTDGRRPDGLTLVPWQKGRCLLWDATCVSTFAACHLGRTVRAAGAAAETTALRKKAKYAELAHRYEFVPFAVETAGCWCAEARVFVRQIGRRLRERGYDPRSGSYLVQRLSIAIQRGNAASVMGTFGPGVTWSGLLN